MPSLGEFATTGYRIVMSIYPVGDIVTMGSPSSLTDGALVHATTQYFHLLSDHYVTHLHHARGRAVLIG
jgi:hypothetical protein